MSVTRAARRSTTCTCMSSAGGVWGPRRSGMPSDVVRRLRQAVEAMPEGLREHVLRVEQEALALAAAHGVDLERARVAALGHDLARAASEDELLALARGWGIEPDDVERGAPILLHGPLGARILRKHYHV